MPNMTNALKGNSWKNFWGFGDNIAYSFQDSIVREEKKWVRVEKRQTF